MAPHPEDRIRDLGRVQEVAAASARERVLAEAFVLFYRYGIRGVGVDMLISRSGVAKASFYRHFPSKQALVVAYIDRREEAWLKWLREEVSARATKPADRLVMIFDVLEEQFSDPDYRGCAVINAVAEIGSEQPEVVERARYHAGQLAAWCAALAAEAHLRKASVVGEQWALLVKGAMVMAMYDGPSAAVRARAPAVAALRSNGHRASATRSSGRRLPPPAAG